MKRLLSTLPTILISGNSLVIEQLSEAKDSIRLEMRKSAQAVGDSHKLATQETAALKGLFTNFFPLFKSHILDSNGVWYS